MLVPLMRIADLSLHILVLNCPYLTRPMPDFLSDTLVTHRLTLGEKI